MCSPLWATKRASPWAAHVLHCTPVVSCCLFWGVQLRGRTPGSLPVSVRVCARVQLSPACGARALGADGPSVTPDPSGWMVSPWFFCLGPDARGGRSPLRTVLASW